MIRRRQYLVLLVALALPTFTISLTRGADDATQTWLRGTGDDLEILLHGEVVEADGTPATSVSVRGGINGDHKMPLAPTVDGNHFEAWIPVNRLRAFSLWLQAEAKDGSGLALHRMNAANIRQAAIDGIRLTLRAPERQLQIKVLTAGQPVPNAAVSAKLGYGSTFHSTTDADGLARLALPAGETLVSLMAWTDDRVGGFTFYRKPTRDPAANEHVIELSPCRDQKIRFLDDAGSPIEGLTFVMQIATPEPNFNFIGTNEQSRLTTNAAGEAVQHWYPDWEKSHFYAELEGGKWIADDEADIVDGVYVYKLTRARQRQRVEMALSGVEVRGLHVTVSSFQAERESHTDQLSAWTDEQGRYAVNVLPDATYCAVVQDDKWVTPMVDFVAFDSALGKSTPPILAVTEGQEVEVFVTKGAEKKPYPNLGIAFFREHEYAWRENGETRHGTDSSQWWANTDESGRAVTRTLPGPLRISVYSPLWRTEERIKVIDGQPATVRLHCNIDEKTRVSGRLVLSEGLDIDPTNIDLRWGAVDGKFDEEESIACDAAGNFALETAATQIGVYAATRDGRAAGAAVAKDLAKPLEVRLVPTSRYEGQLLDYRDAPLANRAVRALVRVEGDEDYNGLFVKAFDAARIETTTDAEGNFAFDNLPCGLEVNLFTDPIEGDDSTYLEELVLEPGDLRPRAVHRFGPRPEAAPKPLAERFATARRDCQLLGYHLMVICTTGSALASEFADRRFVDHDENRDVGAYMQVVITGDQGKLTEEATNFLNEHGWQQPADNAVAAWALDDTGRELGHVILTVDDPEAPQAAADFVHRFMPPQVDAAKKWDEAFAEAERTGRRVWATSGGRYCGPCFRLARWQDDQRDLLAKDYVLFKVDSSSARHGPEVAERITRGGSHGIPFHAILAADGNMLVDSAGPGGNVGFPAGFDGNKQLRKMLMETRVNLTDAEIEQLVKSVGD
jgi:hypothetical protein